MRTERVSFRSAGGQRLAGLLRLPDGGSTPLPVLVQGPGWLGLADAPHYARLHQDLTARGYAILAFDHRGFGDSEGEPGWILPEQQIEDVGAACDLAGSLSQVDGARLGLLGVGGTGAGNAIVAACRDPRVRCVVAFHVVADGADWLRRMRTVEEWAAFQERVTADRDARAAGRPGERIDPREELMVQSDERRGSAAKRATDAGLVAGFHLASADALLRYRPIDEVTADRPRALLVLTVAGDTVTPEDHARMVYARAGAPKRLVLLEGTAHYRAQVDLGVEIADEIVSWCDRHLRDDPVAPGSAVPGPAAEERVIRATAGVQ